MLDTGDVLAEVGELHRSFPHDVANALAAAATAVHGGATLAGAREALLAFRGLPHRVALVGEAGGVGWYDDSKATAPHATRAARARLRLGRADRRRAQQGPRPVRAGGRRRAHPSRRRHRRGRARRGGRLRRARPVRTAASMDEAVAAAAAAGRIRATSCSSRRPAPRSTGTAPTASGATTSRAPCASTWRAPDEPVDTHARAEARRRPVGLPPATPHRPAGAAPAPVEDLRRAPRPSSPCSSCSGW